VNWFRADTEGRFLWPGFSDNLRVLKWILDRCDGKGRALRTPLGIVPAIDGIDRNGLSVPDQVMTKLLKVDPADWIEAVTNQKSFFTTFSGRIPKGILDEFYGLAERVLTASMSRNAPS
jgi:phosphoenolpyruvate carboxykinase (GTP)